MINSINIKNFETHLDTYIQNLSPGVNIFTGESDEGKSGIIRAIKLNAQNRPIGEEYRNDNLDPKKKEDKLIVTSVGIDYKDSGLVIRARDGFPGGVNHYQIETEEPLRALRTDVPDEVQEVTRMKDVNIQGQHPSEQYFLLADKPGQVAKEFNKVAGLSIMDKALADINSQVRECNSLINITKKEIEIKETELKETEWAIKAEKFANKLQGFKLRIEEVTEGIENLLNTVNHIKEIESVLNTHFYGTDKAVIHINELLNENMLITQKERDINTISDFVLSVKSVDLELNVYSDTDQALNALKTLENEKADIEKSTSLIESLKNLILEIQVMEEEVCFAETDYMDAVTLFNVTKETEACPTCERIGK